MLNTPVKVFKIFRSINGEVTSHHQGSICTFIRMSGCNFYKKPCSWCDTKQSLKLSSGELMRVVDVLKKVKKIGCQNITITGGEPLYQKGAINDLIITLSEFGYNLSLETNGSMVVDDDLMDYLDCIVADYKLPSSGCEEEMNNDLFKHLRSFDFVKMAISDQQDLKRSIEVYKTLKKISPARFVFSVVTNELFSPLINVRDILNFLIKSNIKDAIINVQLHKIFNLE